MGIPNLVHTVPTTDPIDRDSSGEVFVTSGYTGADPDELPNEGTRCVVLVIQNQDGTAEIDHFMDAREAINLVTKLNEGIIKLLADGVIL